jgi:hypothetical protein
MTTKRNRVSAVPAQIIERRILLIRGRKVMLDRDLATLYQVTAIALRQAVKRNQNRFPTACTNEETWHANQANSIKPRGNR